MPVQLDMVLPASLLEQVVSPPTKPTTNRDYIAVRCSCGRETTMTVRNLMRKWSSKGLYRCKSCDVKTYNSKPTRIAKFKKSFAKVANTPEHKAKCSAAAKKLWQDEEFAKRQSAKMREFSLSPAGQKAREKALAAFTAKSWYKEHLARIRKLANQSVRIRCVNDPELRKLYHSNLRLNDPEVKERHREATRRTSKERWLNAEYRQRMLTKCAEPEYRKRLAECARKMWANPEYRKKMATIYADPNYQAKLSRISNEINARPEVRLAQAKALAARGGTWLYEETLATILDGMGIHYTTPRPYVVGWHTFDFHLPKESTGLERDLLIEVNGEWIHLANAKVWRDAAKATYIREYHDDKYLLKTIWGREFGSPDRVRHIISEWLRGAPPVHDFDFGDVVVTEANDIAACRKFVSTYHYIGKLGRHSIVLQARLGEILVACLVLTPPSRSESAHRLGLQPRDVLELARFCIHPSYQKRNFASWLLAHIPRFVERHRPKTKCLLSFADTTFGHSGTIYRAANWQYDGKTETSYYYRDSEGFVKHKKTLYNEAQQLHMTERLFAERFGYEQCRSKPKERFILRL